MNNGYYQNPVFPGTTISDNIDLNKNLISNTQDIQTNFESITRDQSYIENVLKLNKGKKAKYYLTIPSSKEGEDKVFEGILEQAGSDHIIVSNPNNGEWYLIPIIYLNYVTFEENINFFKNLS